MNKKKEDTAPALKLLTVQPEGQTHKQIWCSLVSALGEVNTKCQVSAGEGTNLELVLGMVSEKVYREDRVVAVSAEIV